MRQKQKKMIINLVFVLMSTFILAGVVAGIKDFFNRTEALKAMDIMGQKILEYRNKHFSLPPKTWARNQLEKSGYIRLGKFVYRAQWITADDPPDTILAYSQKNYMPIVGDGAVVLTLQGEACWMENTEFEKLLKKQQKPAEMQMISPLN